MAIALRSLQICPRMAIALLVPNRIESSTAVRAWGVHWQFKFGKALLNEWVMNERMNGTTMELENSYTFPFLCLLLFVYYYYFSSRPRLHGCIPILPSVICQWVWCTPILPSVICQWLWMHSHTPLWYLSMIVVHSHTPQCYLSRHLQFIITASNNPTTINQ